MNNNKIGLIVFANDSGLGAQTRRLTYMIKPDRLLAINSSGFSKNKDQHLDWYSSFSGYKVNGFPQDHEVRKFLNGLTHVLVCENPLNHNLMSIAKQMGVKVFIQSNWEFCDHLDKDLELPFKFLMPSHWKNKEMKKRFGRHLVEYLPPPINPQEFQEAREVNLDRNGNKFLHIVGTLAVNDRNGTLDLLEAVKLSQSQFELVIRSQHELPQEYMINDRRVKYIVENAKEAQDMYKDFDALILPRKYGGLSLTTNEALMSALPVIMTNVSPNNKLLPKNWLVKAEKEGEFFTRTTIDIHPVNQQLLSKKIDWLCKENLEEMKIKAFELGYDNFSETVLKTRYNKLWSL